MTGVLNEVKANLLKEDYDCLISLLTNNFTESGLIRTDCATFSETAGTGSSGGKMSLPIKPNLPQSKQAGHQQQTNNTATAVVQITQQQAK